MDPHLLRTFVTVLRCGSFSVAAAQLGYTQSAVSQQIAALESDLGTPLLHRRPVRPTDAGERLLDHAGPILVRLDAARADVRRAAGEPAGRLVVGASPLAAPGLLAWALAEVRRARPGLEVTVRISGREAVVTGVSTGDLDLGLVDGIVAPTDPLRLFDVGPLTAVAVAEEPLAVLLPVGHPLADRAGLRVGDLVDARWIDAPDVAAPLADLRAASDFAGMRAPVRFEGTDVRALVALVAAGHGLAIVPPSAVVATAGVEVVPVSFPRLVHRTELLHGHLGGAASVALAAALRRV